MQGYILSNQSDLYLVCGMAQVVYHSGPIRKIGLGTFQVQAFAGNLGQMLLFHGKGGLIEIFHIQVLQHTAAGNITK